MEVDNDQLRAIIEADPFTATQEVESLEDEECSGRPLKVNKDQLRGSSKLILLQLHKKLLKNSTVYHSVVTQHLKQIGKVKKLDKWVPHELTANQKKKNHDF